MLLYAVAGCLGVLVAAWWTLSPVARAIRRGKGTDPSQHRSALDRIFELPRVTWRDDGGPPRLSRLENTPARRR